MISELSRESKIAVDTEQNGFYAYKARICLIQISSHRKSWVVDPLAGFSVSSLGKLFSDSAVVKIFHAGENDVLFFKKDHGFSFANVFDTMIASQVIGFRRVGLANLLEETFGVQLEKKYQKADWGRRPLTPEMIRYASMDTRLLIPLAEILGEKLKELRREEEAQCEFGKICSVVYQEKKADPDGFLFIKGVRRLDPISLRVLKALFHFRTRTASDLDRAPFRIMGDGVLIEMARKKPDTLKKLGSIRGLSKEMINSRGRKIVDLVAKARSKGPLKRAAQPRRGRNPLLDLDINQARAYEALRVWRKKRAAERGVELFRVANAQLLLDIAKKMPLKLGDLKKIPSLEAWRFKEYGKEIVAVTGRALKREG